MTALLPALNLREAELDYREKGLDLREATARRDCLLRTAYGLVPQGAKDEASHIVKLLGLQLENCFLRLEGARMDARGPNNDVEGREVA